MVAFGAFGAEDVIQATTSEELAQGPYVAE